MEAKLIEEETARRIEEAVRKKIDEALTAESFVTSLKARVDLERKRLYDAMVAEVAAEIEMLRAKKRAEVFAQLDDGASTEPTPVPAKFLPPPPPSPPPTPPEDLEAIARQKEAAEEEDRRRRLEGRCLRPTITRCKAHFSRLPGGGLAPMCTQTDRVRLRKFATRVLSRTARRPRRRRRGVVALGSVQG